MQHQFVTYNGSLECSVLCMIRIRPDALYLTRTTVCSYVSKCATAYIVQIPFGYMVDDSSGNLSPCYNFKEKQKCHQRRFRV